jgi:hypothetical protein
MNRQDRLTKGIQMALRQHARAVAGVPSGEFHTSTQLRDNPAGEGVAFVDVEQQTLTALRHAGVFERVRRVRLADRSANISIWTCPRAYRERAQEIRDGQDSPIGCGHTGIHNIAGGGYTCLNDDCDVEVARAEVEQ